MFKQNKIFKGLLVASALVGTTAVSAQDETVNGYWVSQDKTKVIELKQCVEGSGRLCGDLVWRQGGEADAVRVLSELRASKSNLSKGHLWNKGKAIDAESGKKRDGSVELLADGTLKVSACKRSMCNAEVWQRPSADMAHLPENIRLASR